MLQRLPIALALVKAGNTSGNILNGISKLYTLYREKRITKKVYRNIMASMKLQTEWMPYLLILRIVKYLILADYYWIIWMK